MLRSMYSGISGLRNMQTKLDVIGNNIANVNTYGFKKGRVTFSEAMNQTIAGASAATANKGGTNAKQVGLGSTITSIDTIHTQSSLQTTGRDLDLAVSGDGYFVVKNGNAQFYTRAGNFYLDDAGTLVTSDGLKVQAYRMDAQGNVTNNYGDVTVNVNAIMPAVETKKITFTENLSSDAAVGASSVFTQQIKVTDKSGQPQNLTVYFMKKSATQWGAYLNDPSKSTDADPANTENPANYKIGDITFDAVTGKVTASPASVTVYKWSDGAVGTTVTYPTTPVPAPAPTSVTMTTAPINLDFTNLTQKAGTTTAVANPDGSTQGKLESFNIGSTGEINGVYSNGLIVKLGQLAIAKFSNPSGLIKTGSNTFQESINSGTANINVAGNGRGSIAAGALEMSNVDLSEEFTEMIVAQRGFQANTKIITTSDEILQELVNLKR